MGVASPARGAGARDFFDARAAGNWARAHANFFQTNPARNSQVGRRTRHPAGLSLSISLLVVAVLLPRLLPHCDRAEHLAVLVLPVYRTLG